MPLGDVAAVFSTLPTHRAPTHKDWQRLSLAWKAQLEDRRRAIEALEHELTGCIGCGCLSMKSCLLLNPRRLTRRAGPRPGPPPEHHSDAPLPAHVDLAPGRAPPNTTQARC
ncbi:MerR family DNA-binding protein [Streptomyces tendae]|uniref:MerR family DNA-binding protein n=1 Tax=Streptomyces tendae TaxID=1932 RepID=UPI0036F80DD4